MAAEEAKSPDAQAKKPAKTPAKAAAKDAQPETTAKPEAASKSEAAKPAATKPAAKKPPAKAAEPEKSFEDVISTEVIPQAIATFQSRGVEDLKLTWSDQTLMGTFGGGTRQFSVMFGEEDLKGPKSFSCSPDGAPASVIESFMIDERKVNPELFVFYLVQRIYAQQWF